MSESEIVPQGKKKSKATQNTIKNVLQVRALFFFPLFLKKGNIGYLIMDSVCFE